MKFGPLPPRQAVGGVAAHAIRVDGFVLKKGTVVSEADAAALEKAGIAEVVVARLDPGDVGEDVAAERLAHAMAGPQVIVEAPFTGRSNLFAAAAGILVTRWRRSGAINDVDEADRARDPAAVRAVVDGEMIAHGEDHSLRGRRRASWHWIGLRACRRAFACEPLQGVRRRRRARRCCRGQTGVASTRRCVCGTRLAPRRRPRRRNLRAARD